MTGYVPLLPLVGVLVSVTGVCGAVLLIDQPTRQPVASLPDPPAQIYAPSESAPPIVYNDQVRSNGDAQIILNQSPFSKSRTPFSRTRLTATPRPASQPSIELDPRFLGVIDTGRTQRAVIKWRPDEDVRQIKIGDDTPLGTVTAITSNEIQFEKDGERETLSLY